MGLGSFVFGKVFEATKARVREAAYLEFYTFIHALDAWYNAPEDFESYVCALHHFAVYDARRGDFVADPTGLSIPAERALLSSFWIEALRDARLINGDGTPSRWHESAAQFWDSVSTLRSERDRLLLMDQSP